MPRAGWANQKTIPRDPPRSLDFSGAGASRPISRVWYGARLPARVTAIPLGRPLPAASSNQPGRRPGDGPAAHLADRCVSPLFGLAPGGACRAAAVTGRAVRSYRTVSPLPAGEPAGGLLSVALSLGSPPPDVIRHRVSMEPGLSSAQSGGHPADWRAGHRHVAPKRQPAASRCAALACALGNEICGCRFARGCPAEHAGSLMMQREQNQMRNGLALSLILAAGLHLTGCAAAPPQQQAAGAGPALCRLSSAPPADFWYECPAPPPAQPLPPAPTMTASLPHKPPHPHKPHCSQWSTDVYGDPVCIAYEKG